MLQLRPLSLIPGFPRMTQRGTLGWGNSPRVIGRESNSNGIIGHKAVTVLHSVSGVALCGQVLGLLGPSGCGKSSLLNVLSGQVRASFRAGQRCFGMSNGVSQLPWSFCKPISGQNCQCETPVKHASISMSQGQCKNLFSGHQNAYSCS